jgi:hypothetical protein
MKIGQEMHSVVVIWQKSQYGEAPYPDGLRLIEVRIVSIGEDTVAVCDEDGRIEFRPPSLLFASWEEAQKKAETLDDGEVARTISAMN